MGLQQFVPSPSGSPFHNSDLWSRVGGNKPSPLPLLSPTPASLPVLRPPFQLLQPVPPPTPSWKGAIGNIPGARVLRACTGRAVLTGKLLCVCPPFILGLFLTLLSLGLADCRTWVPQKQYGRPQGFGCKRPWEGARSEEVLSGVYMCMGGRATGKWDWAPFPQETGSSGAGGGGSSGIETQGPHHLLYWPWGTLHKETSPSLLAPTSWALGQAREGEVQLWQCWGDIPKNPGAGVREGQAGPPSSIQIGVGVLFSNCNHFYLILLCVVHGSIYLLSDDALQLWSVYLRRDCILKESITQY